MWEEEQVQEKCRGDERTSILGPRVQVVHRHAPAMTRACLKRAVGT